MIVALAFTAVLIGCLMPVQAGINAQLTQVLKNPFLAAFISFFIGATALFFISIFQSAPFAELKRLPTLPPYLLLGGILGALFVGSSIALIPRLGATTMMASFVTGQLIMSLIIDHYGFFGLASHPFNMIRLAGVGMLFIGLTLIFKF